MNTWIGLASINTVNSMSTQGYAFQESTDDDCVAPLLELAKQWQVDNCEVYDRTRLAKILGRLDTLIDVLGEEKMTHQIEQWKDRGCCSPVIAMWWD